MPMAGSALRWKTATAVQLLLALAVLSGFAFAPPDRGEMLLIPFDGQTISPALLSRLPLVAERPGPLPGSLLVFGSSEGQFIRLLEQGVLILSAPRAMCGVSRSEDDA
jgi:hypothetical protein